MTHALTIVHRPDIGRFETMSTASMRSRLPTRRCIMRMTHTGVPHALEGEASPQRWSKPR